MKCPFRKTMLEIGDTAYLYDELGVIKQEVTWIARQETWPDCLMEKCAAWHDGCIRCKSTGRFPE